MPGHSFLSYSSLDLEFARRLSDALESGTPAHAIWMDKDDLVGGVDWDRQILQAIKTCDALLFLMTADSVEDQSICKQEWAGALRYQKPVIPLLLDPDAEPPFQLASRHYIDATGDFDLAVAEVRRQLLWRQTPAGVLESLQDRLADARRARRREHDPRKQARIDGDIDLLQAQIAEQQLIVADPDAAARRTEASIAAGLERERQPAPSTRKGARARFINPPPGVAPAYYQNFHHETARLGRFLTDDAQRLITVLGRGGVGKTVLVCRLLKALESGRLPDDGGPLAVDGIVYLSAAGSRRLSFANLYADLGKLLPDVVAQRLNALGTDGQVAVEAKMTALLDEFSARRVVLLLDNFEDALDPRTREITDPDLDAALRALLRLPGHGVKVILTSRLPPRGLALVESGRQTRLDLDEGLASPFAENILRAMDGDGHLGLKTAPDDLLDRARELTRGFPRALEALVAILAADRDTSLEDVLTGASATGAEHVVEVLVGEAFSRLDAATQQVMQALAIYGRPVPPTAVDFLLQPSQAGIESAPFLGRLVNMQLVRREAGRYYLHPTDRAYAFERLPKGEPADREWAAAGRFTRFALLARAADYFRATRTAPEQWTTIDDLAPHLAEFDLRVQGHDFETATAVLEAISTRYLRPWGFFRLRVELHERLQGHLDTPMLARMNETYLGSSYLSMGQDRRAMAHFERALAIDQERDDRKLVAVDLSNLAACHNSLGETGRAAELYEQGLAIFRGLGDRAAEGRQLNNLAICYSRLGDAARAIALFEQAVAINRAAGDRSTESMTLANLGVRYGELGETGRAVELFEQALTIHRELGERALEARQLSNLAEVLIDSGRYEEAAKLAQESAAMGEALQSLTHITYGQVRVGVARLLAGRLADAGDAVEAARAYDVPLINHKVAALLGVINLRQCDDSTARSAFMAAVAHADAMLAKSAQNYDALDAKALALTGLALCDNPHHLTAAVESYRAARAITTASGIVARVLRLHDALALADPDGILAPVRDAAAGE